VVQIVKRASDVRIQEINLSQVITAASTAVMVLPVVSKQGEIYPRLFTNSDDYLAEYGNPDPSVSMTIQSGLNYLTEGNQLWGLRVVGAGAKYACRLVYIDVDGSTKSKIVSLENPANTDLNTLVVGAQQAVLLFYPKRGPGSYAHDLSFAISSNGVTAPTNVTPTSSLDGGTMGNGTYYYMVTALTFDGESLPSTATTVAVTGATVATAKVTLSWSPVANAVGYRIYGRVSGSSFGLIATVGAAEFSFEDLGSLTPDDDIEPPTPSTAASTNTFNVTFYDESQPTNGPLEEWECTLTDSRDSSGVQTQVEDRINPFSGYMQVVSNVAALATVPTLGNVARSALGGGDSGSAPTSYQIAQALSVFKDSQLYKINGIINGGIADPIMHLAVDSLAQARGDSVGLLDVPSTKQQFQAAIDYRNIELNLNSTYSALFNPDSLIPDYINGKQVYVPPSGWAAALCARTDRVANPAYSIAGLNRGLLPVLKQRYSFDDGKATALYNAQVNYLRTFSGQGTALWEQQTLAAQYSALSFLSVRRIVNVIKVSLYSFLLYALQEQNTDSLRRNLVNGITDYLDTIKNSDGLYDFTVQCDDDNNPNAAANAGILVVTVVLIPQIPIHEIQLQVVISKRGVSFNETLRSLNGSAAN
jgi:hypothetical protein